MDNVEVFSMIDNIDDKDKHDWNEGAIFVKNTIGDKIDVVFAGSDYIGKNIWENLYPESEIVYFDRDNIKISSTEIRSNPYKYFEYLPKVVQKYYTKKICVIGTESCGKSTLVRNLAKYFNTSYVEEGVEEAENAEGETTTPEKEEGPIIDPQTGEEVTPPDLSGDESIDQETGMLKDLTQDDAYPSEILENVQPSVGEIEY